MHDHEAVILPVVRFHHTRHLDLVLQSHARRVDQLFKLVDGKSDSGVEGAKWRDQGVFINAIPLADFSVVECVDFLESGGQTCGRLVSLIGVDHAEGATRHDD